MPDFAVEVDDLSVAIKKKPILSSLNLRVEEGAFHGIIGPNGAGKTTLFTTIQGFRKPDTGHVRVLGRNPFPRNVDLLANIGIQPQKSSFFPKTSLREHLTAVADILGTKRVHVDALIEALNLSSAADTKIEGLSGGERQRLAVATAITHKPKVLFLDEPTAGLDPEARRNLVDLLQSSDLLGMTTLYTTHFLDEAERLCDVVSILDEGKIIATRSPTQLIAEAQLGSTVLLPAALHQVDVVAAKMGAESVRITRDGLEVRAAETADLFANLSALGIDMSSAQVRDGRLEDVYLALTGKDIVE